MIMAMVLAHLVGDYVLQWDSLAAWKARELKGVVVHCVVVTVVTWLFVLPFDADWWQGVALISGGHFVIDAFQQQVKLPIPALFRFVLDQVAHFAVIFGALIWGGYLAFVPMTVELVQHIQDERLLVYLLGYAFVTMPAWVVVKFVAYGLVRGTAPEFPGVTNKYVEILERLLITTFVSLGQFIIIPLVAVPRLVFEWPRVMGSERTAVYVVELLASIALAVAIGLALSQV